MGHRIQKEFSSDRFKTMSRKVNEICQDIRIYRDMAETNYEDNIAIRKVQKQTGQAVAELAVDVGSIWKCLDIIVDLDRITWERTARQEKLIKKLKRENNDLQKWLEGYIILLFAIVVCFTIVVFVS